ncbi:hypothetical protein QJQ45_002727 [Haematococcus lacustris]|nr:hypothetical protein QJQ45_002727 [Haematococcus lacustris]
MSLVEPPLTAQAQPSSLPKPTQPGLVQHKSSAQPDSAQAQGQPSMMQPNSSAQSEAEVRPTQLMQQGGAAAHSFSDPPGCLPSILLTEAGHEVLQ